jgi:competence CoiA-like predicted nuclease
MSESFTHADTKADLYWSLLQEDDSTYTEIEKGIGRTRTDVLTEVKGRTLAIEIQHTRIPIPSIIRRMREHTEIGAHTLWIITPDAIVKEDKVRNLNWVMFIQKMQGGMIFLPGDAQTVIPARVDNTLIFHKNEIVAGSRKFLDHREPIELADLTFETKGYLGLNTVTFEEWWIENSPLD